MSSAHLQQKVLILKIHTTATEAVGDRIKAWLINQNPPKRLPFFHF